MWTRLPAPATTTSYLANVHHLCDVRALRRQHQTAGAAEGSLETIYEVEAKRALERHESGAAVVLPIIVRRCNWEETPLARLQVLPADAKPISARDDPDHGWLEVARAVRAAAQSRRSGNEPR